MIPTSLQFLKLTQSKFQKLEFPHLRCVLVFSQVKLFNKTRAKQDKSKTITHKFEWPRSRSTSHFHCVRVVKKKQGTRNKGDNVLACVFLMYV